MYALVGLRSIGAAPWRSWIGRAAETSFAHAAATGWIVVGIVIDCLVEAMGEGVIQHVLEQRGGEGEVRARYSWEQPAQWRAPVAAVLVHATRFAIAP